MARRAPFPLSSIPAYIDQSMKLIVCLDSDSDMLVLTTRPGRPAVSPSNLAAGCALLRPLAQPVSPSLNRQTTRYNKPLTQTGWY